MIPMSQTKPLCKGYILPFVFMASSFLGLLLVMLTKVCLCFSDCLVAEGCVSSAHGVHTLLRFTTKIDNIGNADFSIGVPPDQKIE